MGCVVMLIDPTFYLQKGLMLGQELWGGEQAALTMRQVLMNASKKKRKPIDEKQLAIQEKTIIHHFDRQSDAFKRFYLVEVLITG